MIYIALLRGINVGGKNKVEMKQLKQLLENNGFRNVVTYLNTGNIIFETESVSQDNLPKLISKVIEDGFDLNINVLILNCTQYQSIVDAIPIEWANNKEMKSDVWFLWQEVDDKAILDKLPIKSEIDQVMYVPGAILWSVGAANLTRSGRSRVVGTKVYKQITIRNVNTARKIYEIINERI